MPAQFWKDEDAEIKKQLEDISYDIKTGLDEYYSPIFLWYLWQDYSQSLCAGWIYLPSTYQEFFDRLDKQGISS